MKGSDIIKRLAFLLFCILLVSCSKDSSEGFFDSAHLLDVSILFDELELNGTLEVSKNSLTFSSNTPDKLTFKFGDGGSSVSLGELEFSSETADMSRLKKVYDSIKNGSVKVVSDGKGVTAIEGNGFKIKVHKELFK